MGRFAFCDLAELDELKFAHGASVRICHVKTLPARVDVSRCSNVNLSGSCLAQVKPLAFAENAQVLMDGVTHLHPETDFSKCRTVNLSRAEFDDCDNPFPKAITFKNGAMVYLGFAQNLPKNLIFLLSKIYFSYILLLD